MADVKLEVRSRDGRGGKEGSSPDGSAGTDGSPDGSGGRTNGTYVISPRGIFPASRSARHR